MMVDVMDISFNSRIVTAQDVLVSEVGDEAVLLNLKSESYFGLDEMGTRMYKALTGSESVQAAYDSLLTEYEVEPEVLRRDLSGLIQKLQEHGLVEVSVE
jgi:hypothetical protein